jgi:hypothetical protein
LASRRGWSGGSDHGSEQRDLSIAAARLALSSRDLSSGPGRLAALATVLEEAERALRMEVALARGLGVSWSEIGASLGVTRQAAQQRFSLAPAG